MSPQAAEGRCIAALTRLSEIIACPMRSSFKSIRTLLLAPAALVAGLGWHTALAGAAPAAAPVIGKSLRYCNPLPLVASSTNGSPQGISLGDVTVMGDGGKFYMYCTGGGAWVSTDLVNWE